MLYTFETGNTAHQTDRIHLARQDNYHGPACFGPAIRKEKIPVGFKLSSNIKSYNGVAKPDTWLQDYYQAVDIVGGSDNTAVHYLPAGAEAPVLLPMRRQTRRETDLWSSQRRQARRRCRSLTRRRRLSLLPLQTWRLGRRACLCLTSLTTW